MNQIKVIRINFPFYSKEHGLAYVFSAHDIEYVVTEYEPLEKIDDTGEIHFCGDKDWIESRAKEIIMDSRGNVDAADGILYVYEVWNNADDEQFQKAIDRGWLTHELVIENDEMDLHLYLIQRSIECEFKLDVTIR